MIIPLSTLSHLRISRVNKIALFSLFALGIFVIIATTVRAIVALNRPVSISKLMIWSAIEVSVAFIVGNAPACRPLLPRGRNDSGHCSRNSSSGGNRRRPEVYAVLTKNSVVVTVEAGTPCDAKKVDDEEINIMRTVQVTVDEENYHTLPTDMISSSKFSEER